MKKIIGDEFMVYNIGICDDEEIMLNLNKMHLDKFAKDNHLEIITKVFHQGEILISYAKKNTLDIAILDVSLKGTSGIETAKELKKLIKDIVVIFITAHGEYALEACDNLEACAFIMKPVKQDKFNRSLRKGILQVNALKEDVLSTHLIITEENIKKKIFQENILYIEKQGPQCVIKTDKNEYKVYETVTSLMERLEKFFVRISQGVIVNLKEIKEVRGNDVTLKDGQILSIGRTYKKRVREKWIIFPNI